MLNCYLVHSSYALQGHSGRAMQQFIVIQRFLIWSTDAKLSYPQKIEPLKRRIFVSTSTPEFQLEPEEFFGLTNLRYGLGNVETYGRSVWIRRFVEDPGMTQSISKLLTYSLFKYYQPVEITELMLMTCYEAVYRSSKIRARLFISLRNDWHRRVAPHPRLIQYLVQTVQKFQYRSDLPSQEA